MQAYARPVSPKGGIVGELGVNTKHVKLVYVCLSLFVGLVFISQSLLAVWSNQTTAENKVSVSAAGPTVLRIGVLQPITNLNPFTAYEDSDYVVFGLIYDRLIRYDEDLHPQPSIATSWEVDRRADADDPGTPGIDEGANKLWRYHIVQNVFWTDGIPLTADDVAYTINLNLNATMWAFSPYLNYKMADFARAVNSTTVEVYLKIPSVHPETLIIPIVPVHIWGQLSPQHIQYSFSNPNPIGSGPFKFVQFVKDQYVILEKNPDYFLGPVAYDQVVFQMYGSDQVMAAALKNGDIDVGRFPPLTYDSLKGQSGVMTAEVDRYYQSTLGFNCWTSSKSKGNPLLLDDNIRRAMHMAIDKQYIIDTVWRGYADMGYALPAPISPFYFWEPNATELLGFDVARANALLNASGYDKWDNNGIRLVNTTTNPNAPLDTPLSFKFQFRNSAPEDIAAAPYVKEMWQKIGVDVTLLPTDESAMETDVYTLASDDAYIWYWSGDQDPSYILGVMTTDQIKGWNDPYWSNATYDELYLVQMTETGTDRQQTVFEMEKIWYESSGMICLSYPYGLYAWTEKHFTNWGDPVAHPGRTIDFYYSAPALFMNLQPVGGALNEPPVADAGSDRTVYQGENVSFTGSATDPNDPVSSLSWAWTFEEPNQTVYTRIGKTVNYTFENLGMVNVSLTVMDPGGLSNTSRLVVTVILAPANAGWLVGHVNTSAGAPVVGALVSAGDISRTSDSQGFFNLTLEAATYTVNVSATGYADATASVTITAQRETWHNFTLAVITWTLKGHVTDSESGDAIAGANVSLLSGSLSVSSVRTNDTGYYEILYIPFGTYTVNASMAGYNSNETELTVSAAGEHVQDFALVATAGGGGGISNTLLIAAGVVVVVVVVAIVAAMMMKKRKAGGTEKATEEKGEKKRGLE